ncbi:MAG: hypothetical protein IIC95_09335 [Chloroflexi bacterium]|nr:hypothetical protein [Chloroflexota bacterium]
MTSTQIIAAPAPGESWKGIRELERDYGLKHGQIQRWLKRGLIGPEAIREAATRGQTRYLDEFYIRTLVIELHRPRGPKYTRAVLIPAPSPATEDRIIPPQIVLPGSPVTALIPQQLPPDLKSTGQLVADYLSLRLGAVDRKQIAIGTYTLEAIYMRAWALHAPVFPWTQLDIDSYEAQLGATTSRTHSMRYLKTLTLWALKRYPDANLPEDFKVGKLPPPRHDVLTEQQEHLILNHIRAHSYSWWVFSTILNRTGCRPFELTDADWADVTPRGFMTKGRAKKHAGNVYFPPGLYDLILALPHPHTGILFPNKRGHRFTSKETVQQFTTALNGLDHGYHGRIGGYMFRHLYAGRLKDRIPNIERVATLLRTSIYQIEYTYGKHSDDSYRTIIDQANEEIWANDPMPPPPDQ